MKQKVITALAGLCWATTICAQTPSETSFQIKFDTETIADSVIASRKDLHFERVIPFCSNPKLEQRHREAGLYLWYKVDMDGEKAMNKEVKSFSSHSGIKYVQPTKFIKIPENKPINIDEGQTFVPNLSASFTRTASPVVNDPLYEKQWHVG